MLHLKIKAFLLSLCLFMSACQSAGVFKLKTFPDATKQKNYDLHVIEINSDRVRQECLFLNAEAENYWRHQYFMYILSDKNEVLEIMQPTHLDKNSCDSQIQKIKKLLQSEPKVKICARDELKKNTQNDESQIEAIHFGALGSHKVTYDALTLDSICNSKKCVSNNDVWVDTCPGFVKQ